MGEERVVVIVSLTESVAGVENDAARIDASAEGKFQRVREAFLYQRHNLVLRERRLSTPLVGAAAGVHKNDAAAEIGTCAGHLRIPFEAGDVVDDFGAGGDDRAGSLGSIGINREHTCGALAENGFNDGEDAVLFLLSRQR